MSGALQECERALAAAAALPDAFWEIDERGARRDAEATDARRRAGEAPLPLDGVTLAVKDSFQVAGLPRSLGLSHATTSDRDADAVAALRAAGAAVLGTTAMDQLAWTMSGRGPVFPQCENPLLPGCCPGGSSAGAAAAVSSGTAMLALGGDSAGSVRVPAAWCGVIGFKPSFGFASLRGCAPLARRFDTIGIFARELSSIRVALAALAATASGADNTASETNDAASEADDTASEADDAASEAVTMCIGIPTELIEAGGCDAEVREAWRSTRQALAAALPLSEVDGRLSAPGLGTIFAAELAARWTETVRAEPPHLIEPSLREGIERGAQIAASAYVGACDALDAATREAERVFTRVDALALPVAPIAPPPAAQPAAVAVASAFTRAWSGFGWPAIALPLPGAPGVGLQLVGPPGGDRALLRLADFARGLLDTAARS